MSGISKKQADFIADLWDQAGEPFRKQDARGVPVPTHRDGFVQWIMQNRDQVWAQGIVPKLKELVAKNGNKSQPGEMATPKQVAYGRNLDVEKNGRQTFDWDSATKKQAWQWIADLKEMSKAA
ncbi:hypothetical protein [Microbacterium sp. APC 3901]|uniref:hypothetical protein n=1 Tax=Microbacterium sp. APC 3901 TaxID=3035192 RepID=UPI0025B4991D|nr:hypothetical protein [Microbacterium sp. APC 3901]MDN3443400.1 hypothetical protein [Microbacterium sp. APC 3901]